MSRVRVPRDGKFLALVIDATDKVGNGMQLRDMTTGAVTPLDTGNANYERMAWTEKGDALAVLKGKDDRAYRDKLYSVVGVHGFGSGAPKKVIYDPADGQDRSRRASRSAATARRSGPTSSRRFIFGIHEPRKRDDAAAPAEAPTPPAEGADAAGTAAPAGRRRRRGRRRSTSCSGTTRIRACRRSRKCRKRATAHFSYVAMYRVAPKKFVRLADDEMRTVTVDAEAEQAGRSAATTASTS